MRPGPADSAGVFLPCHDGGPWTRRCRPVPTQVATPAVIRRSVGSCVFLTGLPTTDLVAGSGVYAAGVFSEDLVDLVLGMR